MTAYSCVIMIFLWVTLHAVIHVHCQQEKFRNVPDDTQTPLSGAHPSGRIRDTIAERLKHTSHSTSKEKLTESLFNQKSDKGPKVRMALNKRTQKIKQDSRNAKKKNERVVKKARKMKSEL